MRFPKSRNDCISIHNIIHDILGNLKECIGHIKEGHILLDKTQRMCQSICSAGASATYRCEKFPTICPKTFFDIILGLEYLHSKEIVHRDLKPENILFKKDLTWKICDFGLSKVVDESMTPLVGNKVYIAPECGSEYNQIADIYSIGLIMFEVMQNLPDDISRKHFFDKIKGKPEETLIEYPNNTDMFPGWKDLVWGMVQKDVSERLTAIEIQKALKSMF